MALLSLGSSLRFWRQLVAQSAAARGFTVRHVGEALYRYRVDPESTGMRLRYVNFATREFIVERHRDFFERFGGTRPFLAEGYALSAQSSLARSERRRALALAVRAFRLEPRANHLVPILLRTLLPGPTRSAGRRLKEGKRTLEG